MHKCPDHYHILIVYVHYLYDPSPQILLTNSLISFFYITFEYSHLLL